MKNNFYTKKILILLFLIICPYLIGSVKAQNTDYFAKLSDAAISLTKDRVTYDPTYRKITYPNGDVPSNTGVCSDVIIRAYRKLGVDLQKEIHEDMKANFSKYPNKKMWGLSSTDTNIDHRRVPNQEVFFSRKGKSLPISKEAKDYKPGDIVSWRLNNGLAHIGMVVDQKSRDQKRYLIVHNIGRGQVIEDCLFSWKIVGHYRYQK